MATIQERKSKDGKVQYRALVRLRGYPPQSATFERKTDAKKWIQKTEAEIREGRHFKTREAKKHTVAELIEKYIKSVLPTKPKSKETQEGQLNWWKQEIGPYTLADVTPALIGECRDKLLTERTRRGIVRSPASTVRYMAAFSHALTVAVNEWGWLEDSPIRKVKKPKEPRGRVRFLSDDERNRLLEATKESNNRYLYPVVLLALSTGMRYGEIMNLRWEDVDLKRQFVILHDTKNGERRNVPVVKLANAVLTELAKVKRKDTSLVFPSETDSNLPSNLRWSWLTALQQADIADFRFHDLRHSAASYLAMNGATLTDIAHVLGHKTLAMVKRYAHLSEQHTTRVVASMNEKIFGDNNG